MAMQWSNLPPALRQKIHDASVAGAVVTLDPDEAEEMGAFPDNDTPEQDVIDAAYDEADFDLPSAK